MTQVEDKAYQIKHCRAHQVLPDECDKLLQPSILLTLQCAKNGATKQQINQAVLQGELRVNESISKSPFQQIKSKIEKAPFFIQAEKDNFIPFSSQCADYKEKLFRVVAMAINDGQAKFVVSPVKPTTCITTTNLDKKYPFLTAEQLDKFKQGYYMEQYPPAERAYDHIEVLVADTLVDAGQFFSKMKKRSRLSINTIPKNATVKFSGLKRKYKRGMKLNVGDYKVRVSSPTYTTQELMIHLGEQDLTVDIQLVSSIETLVCQEKQQDFPLEFINRHYLKRLNTCTYQLTTDSATNTPFKLLVIKNSHQSKNLLKVSLGVSTSDLSGNEVLTTEELKPRTAIIKADSSGISDVPKSLHAKQLKVPKNRDTKLIILEATFSH